MKPQTPHAVQSCHELLVWLIPQLNKFPRAHRFTLGERLEARVLSVLEDLVTAAYSKQKVPSLHHANLQLEIMRHLWRAALELHLIPMRQYEYGIDLINTVGRQVGGWIKDQTPHQNTRRGAYQPMATP